MFHAGLWLLVEPTLVRARDLSKATGLTVLCEKRFKLRQIGVLYSKFAQDYRVLTGLWRVITEIHGPFVCHVYSKFCTKYL